MVFGGGGPGGQAQRQDEKSGRRNATKEPDRVTRMDRENKGGRENARLVGQWFEVDPPLPPAAIAIPMTTAVPTAIQPIVPEDKPVAAFFPAASPALAAPFASVAGFGFDAGLGRLFRPRFERVGRDRAGNGPEAHGEEAGGAKDRDDGFHRGPETGSAHANPPD